MFYLKRNLYNWERALRLCIGIAIAAAAAFLLPAGILQYVLFAVAGISAATAAVGFCPACAMVGRKLMVRDK